MCARLSVILANWGKKKKLITISNNFLQKQTTFFKHRVCSRCIFAQFRICATCFDTDLCESTCVGQKEMIKIYKLRQRRRRAAGSKTSKPVGPKERCCRRSPAPLLAMARPAMFGKCSDENKE